MASAQKEVQVKVATKEELSGVEAIELRMKALEKQRIQLHIDAKTDELNKTSARIEELKRTIAGLEAVPAHLGIDIDEQEINKLKGELAQLEQKSLDLQLAVETGELQKAKADVEELDGKNIELNLAMQNFSEGISQAKQGISDLASNMNEVAQAGMQTEQNKAFLAMNLGADKAKQTYEDISNIVKSMPGDDNTMRSVLSTAQALGNNLNADEMKAAAGTMADYMSGSATMGKQALESQQDIMKYLLDGNTAELERGSIVSSQVDKLKEATTFQERQAAMQEVLNQLGYGGISQTDTMLNKQAEWDGMIYNSQDKLSSMWLTAQRGAMDYIIKLDEGTNGLVGMGIVAAQMVAGPIVSLMSGISQIGMGFKTLKDAADFSGLTGKFNKLKEVLGNVKTKAMELGGTLKGTLTSGFNTVKTKAMGLATTLKSSLITAFTGLKNLMTGTIIPTLRNTATSLLNAGRAALTAGANALKSAGLWLIEKGALVAHKIASFASAAAQWVLNAAMSANPITLVAIAILALVAVLGYLYFNNEQVRNSINGLGQALMGFGQWVYNGAIYWLQQLQTTLMNLWNYIFTLGGLIPANVNITGNQIIDTILRVLAFLLTLPLQLAMIFVNIIAQALGFGNNFSQRMITAASRAVQGFISYIQRLPGIVMDEFNRVLGLVNEFISSLPSRVWEMGAAIIDALKASLGIGSPGHMFYMVEGEFKRIDDLTQKTRFDTARIGKDMVDSFNPELGFGFNYKDTVNSLLDNVKGENKEPTVVNFYFTDTVVDNDKRMERIAEYITRKLNFDNSTAGRTV